MASEAGRLMTNDPALIPALALSDGPLTGGWYETSCLAPAFVRLGIDSAHLNGVFTADDLRVIALRMELEVARRGNKAMRETLAIAEKAKRDG